MNVKIADIVSDFTNGTDFIGLEDRAFSDLSILNSSGDTNLNSDMLKLNNRPRYIEGKKVALDYVQGSPKKMFGAPGEILAIRKSVLLKYSGFDKIIDISQILKYLAP